VLYDPGIWQLILNWPFRLSWVTVMTGFTSEKQHIAKITLVWKNQRIMTMLRREQHCSLRTLNSCDTILYYMKRLTRIENCIIVRVNSTSNIISYSCWTQGSITINKSKLLIGRYEIVQYVTRCPLTALTIIEKWFSTSANFTRDDLKLVYYMKINLT